jgi:hypothetical protein
MDWLSSMANRDLRPEYSGLQWLTTYNTLATAPGLLNTPILNEGLGEWARRLTYQPLWPSRDLPPSQRSGHSALHITASEMAESPPELENNFRTTAVDGTPHVQASFALFHDRRHSNLASQRHC